MPYSDSRRSADSGRSGSGSPIAPSRLRMETTSYGSGLAVMPTTTGWWVCKG